MALESLGNDELRKMVLKWEDLKNIPVCDSTRALVIRKLTERGSRGLGLPDSGVKLENTPGSSFDKAARSESREVSRALPDIKPARQIEHSSQASDSQSREGKPNEYSSPTIPELNRFRLLIERNDTEGFKKAVLENNPRLLVTSSDTPEILKRGVRYNALHCAAIKGYLDICKILFEILKGNEFWNMLYPQDGHGIGRRRRYLIDLYLNTCEEGVRMAVEVSFINFLLSCW